MLFLGSPIYHWTILLGLIFLIVCLLRIIFLEPFKPLNVNSSISELLEQVDNGDLLFFSGETYGEKAIRWYSNSYFSHVAIVLRDMENGKSVPFLWEADIGQRYREGPRVMRLQEKLERWKGSPFIAWRKLIGKRPSTQSILEVVDKFEHYQMDNSMTSWFWADHPFISDYLKEDKTVFCSELVVLTLQELGLMNNDKKAYSYSPEDLITNKIDFNGCFYSEPQYFSIR
jgi:hypothetical protein